MMMAHFVLDVDASDVGIGGILNHIKEGSERVLLMQVRL